MACSSLALRGVYAYSPYGTSTTLGPDDGNPLQYTGRENDGTGQQFNRGRYYDYQLKRWTSEDPIRITGGINLYAYVSGNPAAAADPFGLYDIIAVVWTSRYAQDSAGHVVLATPDGRILTSQYPVPRGLSGPNTTRDWAQTLMTQGREPDAIYRITVPDSVEAKVLAEAAAQRAKMTWNWAPTDQSETNCATAAISVLFGAGVRSLVPGAAMPPFTPNNFNDAMKRAANARGGNVSRIGNVPW